jgi:hypothetical protein
MKVTAGSPGWPGTYFAVSKVPWLKALAAWETCGTWTWGCEFSDSGRLEVQAAMGKEPFQGNYRGEFSVAGMSTEWLKRDLWNELKRGWRLAQPGDPLLAETSGNQIGLRHDQPGGKATLGLIHQGVDFSRGGMEGVQLDYFLQTKADDVAPLDHAAWADWVP